MNNHTSPTPGFDALAAANPVPDEALDQLQHRRKAKTLRDITGDGSSWSAGMKVAAAVGVLALAGLSIPLLGDNAPEASAQEVLIKAADSSLSKQSPADSATNVGFIRREDSDDSGTITSVYKVDAGGMVTAESTTKGTPSFTVAELTDPESLAVATSAEQLTELAGADQDRGLLTLLMNPYLTGHQQQLIFQTLSTLDGTEVTEELEDQVTITSGDVNFSLIPSTGQLTHAENLTAPGVTTRVAATAILGCVNVEGLQGPDSITIACADNNYTVHDIEWETWGDETSVGHGTAWINDCEPFCADGTFHTYPVTVTVRDKQTCGYQADIYSKLDIEYDDASMNETFDIGCV